MGCVPQFSFAVQLCGLKQQLVCLLVILWVSDLTLPSQAILLLVPPGGVRAVVVICRPGRAWMNVPGQLACW